MTADNKILDVEDLVVAYDETPVLDSVNLSISEGEVFGLAGLNGEGKTTLIKTITGLRTPDQGEVRLFGKAGGLKSNRFRVSYLPERFNPPSFLTGFEFLKFSSALYREPFDKDKALDRAESLALDRESLSRRVNTYSKGMRQKVGLISVLNSPATFLILDEPMSGLDPKARSLVKAAIEEARDEGKTILMCSHILTDLNVLCDRMGVLSGGKIIFEGEPDTLLAKEKSQNLEDAFLKIISPKAKAA